MFSYSVRSLRVFSLLAKLRVAMKSPRCSYCSVALSNPCFAISALTIHPQKAFPFHGQYRVKRHVLWADFALCDSLLGVYLQSVRLVDMRMTDILGDVCVPTGNQVACRLISERTKDGVAAAKRKRPSREPLDLKKVEAAIKLVENITNRNRKATWLGRSTIYREMRRPCVGRPA